MICGDIIISIFILCIDYSKQRNISCSYCCWRHPVIWLSKLYFLKYYWQYSLSLSQTIRESVTLMTQSLDALLTHSRILQSIKLPRRILHLKISTIYGFTQEYKLNDPSLWFIIILHSIGETNNRSWAFDLTI